MSATNLGEPQQFVRFEVDLYKRGAETKRSDGKFDPMAEYIFFTNFRVGKLE